MKAIIPLLQIDDLMVTLVSPPASGKTRLIFSLLEQTDINILFISPLRALNEELKLKLIDYKFCDLKNYKPTEQYRVLLATAESFHYHALKLDCPQQFLVVIDEVHLFYMWESFRPLLKNVREDIFKYFSKVLLLSATISEEHFKQIELDSKGMFTNKYLIDLGNFSFKKKPDVVFVLPFVWRKFYWQFCIIIMTLSILKKMRLLVFCKYRREVYDFLKWLKLLKINALGCVGGEAAEFSRELVSLETPPRIIASTTVLSHGVNLPSIKCILFNYDIQCQELFVQMLTRAGRRGEQYIAIVPKARYLKDKLNYQPFSWRKLRESWKSMS